MNVLKKCCCRSMKENRKRTVVTVIGILLATALITAVACMASSFRASMILLEKKNIGDFHYLFTGVMQENLKYFRNNQNVERIGLAEEIGYALLEDCTNPDKPYLYVRAADEAGMQAMSLELTQGRMPVNEEEIVIGMHIRSNGEVDLGVGDVLTVRVGERVAEGYSLNQRNPYIAGGEEFISSFEKTYTIVGIVERPSYQVEPRTAPGYSVFTYLENPEAAERLEVYALYTKEGLRNGEQVTAGLLGISPEEYAGRKEPGRKQAVSEIAREAMENHGVVRWELMRFSSPTMNMLYGMSAIAILVIIMTSVFCIRNSFVISLTEKMKLYGRLASIGTTSGQRRKIVFYEAGYLAAVGIPLGILSGILAAIVVVMVTGSLMEEELGVKLIFCPSVSAIVLAAVLSLVTVYLSASGSARRAARLTPVNAIRSSSTVKISRKELKCPGIIVRLFGIGGKLAYRSLQRSKVKYRTTVISIAVSVAVFIGAYSFIELASVATKVYYQEIHCQLLAYAYGADSYGQALEIAAMEGVEQADVRRRRYFTVGFGQNEIPYLPEYTKLCQQDGEDISGAVMVVSLGEKGYERYCRELGTDPEMAGDMAIVIASCEYVQEESGKRYHFQGDMAQYHRGDVIEFTDMETGVEYEIPVLLQTDVLPMCMKGSSSNIVQLIVSDRWWEEHDCDRENMDIGVYIRCENADTLEETIRRDFDLRNFTLYNYDAEYRSSRSMYLAVAIFLYGFIVVVSLIGVTNIFNTVTTNMELRGPELAMCRSVGMTRSEFRRMIWLENLFYGGKGLLSGIPMGIVISLGFHRTMGAGLKTGYLFPVGGILISVAAVTIMLLCIMKYSLRRFHSKNIIETIQNENI